MKWLPLQEAISKAATGLPFVAFTFSESEESAKMLAALEKIELEVAAVKILETSLEFQQFSALYPGQVPSVAVILGGICFGRLNSAEGLEEKLMALVQGRHEESNVSSSSTPAAQPDNTRKRDAQLQEYRAKMQEKEKQREEIKRQIALDRKEQKLREKAQSMQQTQQEEAQKVVIDRTVSNLAIRLPNDEIKRHQFKADDSLLKVRELIASEYEKRPFGLRMMYPNKPLDMQEARSLEDLGLVPSGTLVVSVVADAVDAYPSSVLGSVVSSAGGMITSLVSGVFNIVGYAYSTISGQQQQSEELQQDTPKGSNDQLRQRRINTLERNDDEQPYTYNGNSTGQE